MSNDHKAAEGDARRTSTEKAPRGRGHTGRGSAQRQASEGAGASTRRAGRASKRNARRGAGQEEGAKEDRGTNTRNERKEPKSGEGRRIETHIHQAAGNSRPSTHPRNDAGIVALGREIAKHEVRLASESP